MRIDYIPRLRILIRFRVRIGPLETHSGTDTGAATGAEEYVQPNRD
jgi:hypothetical protein